MSPERDAPQAVGVSVPRTDGVEKVTGAAEYAADVRPPGPWLWAKVLRSPLPHARIVRIDATRARRCPGVHVVLTGADVAGRLLGRRIKDAPVLAQDVVRFVGDPVAAVAADDEESAERAAALIVIEYEELPAVFDPLEAVRPGSPLVHPDVARYEGLPHPLDGPTNVFVRNEWGRGDVDAGLAGADVVVENTFTTARMHQAYMEPNSCLVWIDPEERVQVWASSKIPHTARSHAAYAIGVPPERIRLLPVTIGGDFGGKGQARNVPLCYFLAKASGRPVRMVSDYTEEFMASNPRHPAVLRVRTGVMRDGTIVAHEVDIVFDSGAYGGFIPGGFLPGARSATGPYRIPNARITASHVYTNSVPGGYMRGPGRIQAVFSIESQMDCVAEAIGMDPIELRAKNLVRDGDETGVGERFHHVRGVETLEAAASAAAYGAPKAPHVGRGIALTKQEAGGGVAHASVALGPDGSVVLGTPIFEQGTGTYTLLRQVVAEVLGLAPERVRVEVWDTDAVESDSGISGDRGARLGTQAAYGAAEAAGREACKLAAELLGWPEERLRIRGDDVVRDDTGDAQPWAALLARTGEPAVGAADVEDDVDAGLTAFTVQIAEVAVDVETGRVRLLRLTSAHDTGRIVNPQGHQGQIDGGVVQGVGYGMMEELRSEGGRVLDVSFADYKVPTVADIPELTTVLLEPGTGFGPLNVKSIGETGNGPTAAAIANAVFDAVGVRVRDLPVTAERVHRALKEVRG
ncbi:MAG: xanthine dehydrogenase family protein molybdopterin-binding subunit [Chloroflexi bacterium]|nr:xanthine dehydrogenase family protein molybdopterin-binding subunit [Chloroflexota bacterium]MCH7655330.1 xanthine dehydrogenase family protein molybdopterin-binding subunit [Chloroflexota bacterium]